MADIKISDLKIAGSDLFTDTENYLQDLSEEDNFQGGFFLGGMFTTFVAIPFTRTYILTGPSNLPTHSLQC